MRVPESGFIFEFPEAWSPICHDRATEVGGEGNVYWKGVDFRVKTPPNGGEIWVEVKNFAVFASELPSSEKRKRIGEDVRQKLMGTTAFLYFSDGGLKTPITYAIVIALPSSVDSVPAKLWFLELKRSFAIRSMPTFRDKLKIWVGTAEEFVQRHPGIIIKPVEAEGP